MPNKGNMSEEEYLDKLLSSVSGGIDSDESDSPEIDDLNIENEIDEEELAKFDEEIEKELADDNNLVVDSVMPKNELDEDNTVYKEEDNESKDSENKDNEGKNDESKDIVADFELEKSPDEIKKENKLRKKEEKKALKAAKQKKKKDSINESANTKINEIDDVLAEAFSENKVDEIMSEETADDGFTDEKVEKTVSEDNSDNNSVANEIKDIFGNVDVGFNEEVKKHKFMHHSDGKPEKVKKEKHIKKEKHSKKNKSDKKVKDTRTAEERSLDNSVEEELADLGLNNLFAGGQEDAESTEAITEVNDEPEKAVQEFSLFDDPSSEATESRSSIDDIEDIREREPGLEDGEDDEEEEDGKSKKGKKGKKEKKKKEKKSKPKKEKKPKEPDEIVPFSKPVFYILLSMMALLVFGVAFGGSYYNYEKKMSRAVSYFIDDDYKSAYEEIAGLDIREADKFFYEQIKIVMTVENNYDSFKALMKFKKYDQALDYLLKGVSNFDLYQKEAREYESFDDLQVSLKRIVNALEKYYGITESEAREINLLETHVAYSNRVHELAANVNYDPSIPFDDETTIKKMTEEATTEQVTTKVK